MICGALVAGLISGCAAPTRPPAEHPRVLLIGVDGLDPDILERRVAAGEMPVLGRLLEEGAYGRLRSREPLLSPLIWTTLATGRAPEDHGILDFIEVGANGEPVPITSTRRRVPALWNILSAHGRRSGFLGWYGTYPAEEVRGFQASDRLGFHQVESAGGGRAVTWPRDLASILEDRIGRPEIRLAETRHRFLENPEAELTADGEERLEQLARIHATAELYRRTLPFLAERHGPELLAVYFELVDACSHLFMENEAPRLASVSDADFEAFKGTVGLCHAYQDEVIGELLEITGPETTVVVVSDHGFKSGNLRPRTSGRADTGRAGLWHRLHGVVLMHGAGVRSGRIEEATIFDLAPTLLRLLGIPVAETLPGKELEQAFEAAVLPPRRSVPSYAWSPVDPAEAVEEATSGDAEQVRQLEALGYLGGGRSLAHDDDGRTATSYVNEGTALAAGGDLEGALLAYSRALRLEPKEVDALSLAAGFHLDLGDLELAERLLDRAYAVHPQHVMTRLGRARLAMIRGRLDDAAAELEAANRLDDRVVHVPLLQARLANAMGRGEQALDHLSRAESLTAAEDLLAEILLFRSRVAAELGQVEVSQQALDRASALVPESTLAAARGELAMARGLFAEAAGYFEEAASPPAGSPREEHRVSTSLWRKLGQARAGAGLFPESEQALRSALDAARSPAEKEGAYGDLALLFQKTGREDRVVEVLEEALAALPASAPLWGMRGASLGRRGQLEAATEAYERSVRLGPTPLACKTLATLVLELRGDRERALELWRQSLALDPRQRDVMELLATHGS